MRIYQCERNALAALCLAILAALPSCAGKKPAATEPGVVQATVPQATAEPAEAKDILMRMARYLASTPRFSVTIDDNYDVLQESGQMIEFGESRQITVSRPDHLRVEVAHSNGDKPIVLYDGKDITVFSPEQNVYAQASIPGGIDAAVVYFLKTLHMRLPLAALLRSRLPEEFEERTQSLEYVERTELMGTPAHHVAGRSETVDYQLWIAEGAQPLPLRVVLTYKNADGDPQFRAQFSNWNLAPQIQDAQFVFKSPEGARKIAFLAQLATSTQHGAANPASIGGPK